MNYYKHSIGDYRRDTAHLSLLEHGIYRQLLDWYYLDEKPLPVETHQVFRRLSARTEDERNAVQIILEEFFSLTERGWEHKRCEAEISAYQAKADASRANGTKGGRPKKTQEKPTGFISQTENNLNHKPLTTNHNKELTTLSGTPDDAQGEPSETEQAKEAIEYLNSKTRSGFKPVGSNLDLVKARLREGYDLDAVKSVIDAKVLAWADDAKMREFLRPKTLFNRTNFSQYAGSLPSGPGGAWQGNWWEQAGFGNPYEAENAGCTERTSYLWREGRRLEATA